MPGSVKQISIDVPQISVDMISPGKLNIAVTTVTTDCKLNIAVTTVTKDCLSKRLILLADPGEARGCSTNTFLIN